MKFAFCLIKYFQYGGLQRDFTRIANVCLGRGHEIDVYSAIWQGDKLPGINVSILPTKGFANHIQRESFIKNLSELLARKNYHAVVGFNKMPGLHVYFAADPCFAEKAFSKSFFYRLTSRSKSNLRLEQAVFDKESFTQILSISNRQKDLYMKHYHTPSERFHMLPPGITKDRLIPPLTPETRNQMRKELGIDVNHRVILMVGTGYQRKGVDRAILALSSLPSPLREQTHLLVIGENKLGPYQRLAKKSGVSNHVIFLGGRTDVPRFLAISDILLHPARIENTGTVLIEAMASGLAVLATDICGYGFHIVQADAGKLIPSPFHQKMLNMILADALTSDKMARWQENGRKYIAKIDVFSLPEKAVDVIEQTAS
ncbi:MAG: glycosyltransferase family 4 protein [Deltaproteobacteria bacterium]|nr:glycosyltransferase family 4 protein [Deltaproteobacteria bacterium]